MKPTDTRPLGKTGLDVTIASYGGGSVGNFGRFLSNKDANDILDAAWDGGIRYFDTAPFYGRGRSERRIGAFLDEKPRDDFVLSTKVGRLLQSAPGGAEEDGLFINPSPFDPYWDYSYDGVMRSYDYSLHRLGLDRIDILYIHDIGVRLHGDDAENQLRILKGGGIKALEELRSSGTIKGYGLGVTEVAACLDCLDYGSPEAFLLAGRYNLAEQAEAKPLLDKCLEQKVSLVIGAVFASGILATGPVPGARYDYAPASDEMLARVKQLQEICARHGTALSAASLQFPLAHPAVATVLLGAGSLRSLGQCVEGLQTAIPQELWDELLKLGLIEVSDGMSFS